MSTTFYLAWEVFKESIVLETCKIKSWPQKINLFEEVNQVKYGVLRYCPHILFCLGSSQSSAYSRRYRKSLSPGPSQLTFEEVNQVKYGVLSYCPHILFCLGSSQRSAYSRRYRRSSSPGPRRLTLQDVY